MFERDLQLMKRDALETLQWRKLRRIVRYAYGNVPAIRRRFKAAGVEPDRVRRLEDFARVPLTTKEDFTENYPLGLLAVPREKLVRLHASSGTTGKPKVVAYTRNDLETWTRLMARLFDCAGVTAGDVVQNMYGYGLFTGGLGFHYGAERVGALVVPTGPGNTKRQLMLLKDLGATVIACTPSYGLYLGEVARAEGLDPKKDFHVRVGLFGAEPWSEEARGRVQDAFGLRAMDCYGMSELYGPGVSCECPEQDGLHTWADEFYVETIDPETEEVLGPGEEGELVVTMLNREAMPILRYRTRDLSKLDWERCACGRHHPRMARVVGRSDDMLIIGGVNVFPSQVEHVLMQVPDLAETYQIIVTQEVLDKLHVRVELAPDRSALTEAKTAAVRKRTEEDLRSVLGIHASVELVKHGALPRSEGKAKRIVDVRTL
ncbi:MAG TPA: phenylacetate--CoA ligase [Thermoplasmata archaeon]|nr:phenylacetate--CoA ligase [Thermoplasmata archaeon]